MLLFEERTKEKVDEYTKVLQDMWTERETD